MPYHRFGRHPVVYSRHRAKKLGYHGKQRMAKHSLPKKYKGAPTVVDEPAIKVWIVATNPHKKLIINPKLLEMLNQLRGPHTPKLPKE